MDIKSPEERSKNMAAIHSKNTKPEIYFRKLATENQQAIINDVIEIKTGVYLYES